MYGGFESENVTVKLNTSADRITRVLYQNKKLDPQPFTKQLQAIGRLINDKFQSNRLTLPLTCKTENRKTGI